MFATTASAPRTPSPAFWAALVLVGCTLTNRTSASVPSFMGIGVSPGATGSNADAVSHDGLVVTGRSFNPFRAYRWTAAGGMVFLPTLPGTNDCRGWGINHDGSVIGGECFPPTGPRAFRWTAQDGTVDLGTLPGQPSANVTGVSADGAMTGSSGGHFHRWTLADGMEDLGVGQARDINDDGSVVVGRYFPGGPNHAFRWSAATGLQNLGLLPGGTTSQANGVSGDGSVVVGAATTSGPRDERAFRWTAADGMVSLGTLQAGQISHAEAASFDGSVVVGGSVFPGGGMPRAFMWSAPSGMVDLNVLLTSLGIDLTGWTLEVALDITPDGSTIVGNGIHNGHTEGWIATIPEPSTPGLLALAAASALRPARRRRVPR